MTKYAIPPFDCGQVFSANKAYKMYGVGDTGFYITDNLGKNQYCLFEWCAHLDNYRPFGSHFDDKWIIIESDCDEINT